MPILRTLLRLAWPNVVALTPASRGGRGNLLYRTARRGIVGPMALVFPFVILTMTMSGGAMGGGVTSAIALCSAPATRRARCWHRTRC